MEPVYETLTNRAREVHNKYFGGDDPKPRRVLIALAGPPGCGKSTVAREVVERLNRSSSSVHFAVVLPMDGFHLSRATLAGMRNSEEAFARRGAEWTFDAEAVMRLVRGLHRTRENLTLIHEAPSFDHELKDPVERSIQITSNIELIILEGNWLLLNQQPWLEISKLVDDTWFIDVDPDLALTRVAKRHIACGIETDLDQAVRRAQVNDLVNGSLVRKKLVPPAIRVQSVQELEERCH